MAQAPDIIIQLIHIQGPLKGEVREFVSSEVTIGRNPSCSVSFPKDQMTISRLHATIVREGNRFKLIDQSANGTLVNGKFITEQFLKDGDVIFITEEGPKISFLTRMPEANETMALHAAPAPVSGDAHVSAPEPVEPQQPMDETPPEIHVQETAVQFVVQYGPNLYSYKKMPVSVGRHPESDLVLPLEAISDRHARFFYNDGEFWIEDLTGGRTIEINGNAVNGHQQMAVDDRIRMSGEGPTFTFIGGGRLVEMEDDTGRSDPDEAPAPREPDSPHLPFKKKKKNPFKAFFKR